MSKKTADNNVKEEGFLTDKHTEIQSLQCEIDNFFELGELFGEELGEILIWQAEKNGMTVENLLEEYSEFFWKVSATDGEGCGRRRKKPIIWPDKKADCKSGCFGIFAAGLFQVSMRSFMRKLEPSMMTVSPWWRRRSRTAEVMVESPLKMEDHCL